MAGTTVPRGAAALGRSYKAGYEGDAVPDWADKRARGAYRLGKEDKAAGHPRRGAADLLQAHQGLQDDDTPGEQPSAPTQAAQPAKPSSRKPPAASSAPAASPSRFQKRGGALGYAARGVGFPGGDGGGLLLALILYPLGLAVIKHGPAGIPLWFRAKFLNQTPSVVAHGAGAGILAGGQALTKPKPRAGGAKPTTPQTGIPA